MIFLRESLVWATAYLVLLDSLTRPLDKRALSKIIFLLFINQKICCGYLNGPLKLGGSFENQKHRFKQIDKGKSKFRYALNVCLT